jgi:hypothetical protein
VLLLLPVQAPLLLPAVARPRLPRAPPVLLCCRLRRSCPRHPMSPTPSTRRRWSASGWRMSSPLQLPLRKSCSSLVTAAPAR